MAEEPRKPRPVLVSFSGIDGAGKSTQIKNLHARLSQAGVHIRLIAFWDDIAVLKNLRESSGTALFKGEKGVGTPGQPVNRRDKNVQSWYMTGFRLFLYVLDAASLGFSLRKTLRAPADVVICDRYLYDELANLPLNYRAIRGYVRVLLKFVPQPDIAYLLDADPVQARERKPEYPLEFVRGNRAAYLALSELVGGMTVVSPLPESEVEREVLQEILKKLSLGQREAVAALGQPSGGGGTAQGAAPRMQEWQSVSGS